MPETNVHKHNDTQHIMLPDITQIIRYELRDQQI
jgi:hypothetical protein